MPKIKSLGNQLFPYEFEPDDVALIDEMIGRFGNNREEVIVKALSLLYTIFTERKNATTVVVQDGSGRTVIPL